jgi:hypothetical protein
MKLNKTEKNMKKLLLFLSIFIFAAYSQAQIKVWDLAGEQLGSPYADMLNTAAVNALFYPNIPIGDPLYGNVAGAMVAGDYVINASAPGITYHTTKADIMRTNNTTQTRNDAGGNPRPPIVAPYTNGTTNYVGALTANGTGSTTDRHLLLDLTIGDEITIICAGQATGGAVAVNFKLEGPGGSSITGPYDNNSAVPTPFNGAYALHITAAATGTYKMYSSDNKLRIYRIYNANVNMEAIVTTGEVKDITAAPLTLGLDDKISPVTTNVQAIGDRIYVSNVKSNTDVKIYSITGALVKAFKTNSDMDFTFISGLYIATVKTFEGQKSVKLLLN